MIQAAIVGMGWWGRTLVESVQSKHVFCEKPFALTKADADAAVAATNKAGVTSIKGPAEVWEAARHDVTRACLEAFGAAASGGAPFLIPTSEIVHGAAVTEAVVRSAESGSVEAVA